MLLRAIKCVSQSFDGEGIRCLLDECLTPTSNAMQYALEHGIDSRKGMKVF
jgi:hypothetical protein